MLRGKNHIIRPRRPHSLDFGAARNRNLYDCNTSCIVTFSGQAVGPNVNNIISSNQNGSSQDNYPIIVYAYVSS
jgi:hypothetical protein